MIDEFSRDGLGWARFSDDRRHRYRLARSLDESPLIVSGSQVTTQARQFMHRSVTFVMLNPSTADAFKVDPTVRRCIGFARAWGADLLQVVNLFAVRGTDPRVLYDQWLNRGDDTSATMEVVDACIYGERVVVAWGRHGALNRRGWLVAKRLRENNVALEHFGLTKNEQPKHPLYLPASTAPLAFEALR